MNSANIKAYMASIKVMYCTKIIMYNKLINALIAEAIKVLLF